MDSDSHNVGARLITSQPHTERNVGTRLITPGRVRGRDQSRPYVQAIAVLCSLLLMFISLLFITMHSYAASPLTTFKKSIATLTQTNTGTATTTIAATDTTTPTTTVTATDTTTPTTTATATNTPTPTATATNTPTPTATATKTPTPTATATRSITPTATTPGSTPTAGTTPTRSVTTPTPGTTLTPGTTPTLSTDQTPTITTGNPTTTTNGGGSGNSNNPSPPTSQSNWLSLSTVITGLLIVLSIVSALFIGLVVMRNLLLPTATPNANLPPSGAQPWKRVRVESLSGITYNQNDLYTAATMPGTPIYTPAPAVAAFMNNMFAQSGTPTFAQQSNITANGNNNGFPPSPQWGHSANTHSFSPPQQWNNTPGTYGFQPVQKNDFVQNSVPPLQSGSSTFQQSVAPIMPIASNPPVPPFQMSPLPPPSQLEFPPNSTIPPSVIGTATDRGAGTFPRPVNGIQSSQTGTFTAHRQVEFSPTTTGDQPAIQSSPRGSNIPGQRKTTTRPLPTSIRLRAMQRNSDMVSAVPANPDSNSHQSGQPVQQRESEEVPSLNDPFLRDTLNRYILRGQQTSQQGSEIGDTP